MPHRIFSFTLLLVTLAAGALSAETMYIKKNNTKMTAAKSPMSDLVTVLSRGVPVNVLKKKGRHYLVRGGGSEGWVFKFKLTKTRPAAGGGGGTGSLLAGLTGESTVSARESGSEGSIRGLKKVSRDYAVAKNISPEHIEAVERMEKFSVDEKELVSFKKSGAIGEFSN